MIPRFLSYPLAKPFTKVQNSREETGLVSSVSKSLIQRGGQDWSGGRTSSVRTDQDPRCGNRGPGQIIQGNRGAESGESGTTPTFKESGDREETQERVKRKWSDRRKGKRVGGVQGNETKAGLQEKWEVGAEPAVAYEPPARVTTRLC